MIQAGISSLSQPMSFQCQNCREYINTSMNNCAFCQVAINHDAAMMAADHQTKIASACNNASFLKVMARAMVAFYLVSWIPIVGGAASVAFFAMAVIVPTVLAVWWIRYSGLQTGDPDFEDAKRNTIIALAIWSAMIVIWVVLQIVWVVAELVLGSYLSQ